METPCFFSVNDEVSRGRKRHYLAMNGRYNRRICSLKVAAMVWSVVTETKV
jgi:hypothetical protein